MHDKDTGTFRNNVAHGCNTIAVHKQIQVNTSPAQVFVQVFEHVRARILTFSSIAQCQSEFYPDGRKHQYSPNARAAA